MMEKVSRSLKNRLDLYLAAGGALFGIVIFLFASLRAPDYKGTGLMLAASCAAYFLMAWRREVSLEFPSVRLRYVAPVLNIIFLGLLVYSLLVLHSSTGGRPLGYFIAVALMSTTVALEIATAPPEAKARQALILAKIILIALSLRWSLFYVYPGSYLGTDPWGNAAVFSRIIDAGHLLPEIGGYYYMPAQHLVVAATAQLTGLAVREALMLSIGMIEVLSLLFVFLLGRQVYSGKSGLLAALLLAVNNLHVMWGWWLVAQTAGIALVSLLLFLVFTPQSRGKAAFRALTIITLIMLIITHSVSSFVALVILLILYAGNLVYGRVTRNQQINSPGNLLIFFAVALVGYWLYISNFFPEFLRMIWGIGPEYGAFIEYTPSLAAGVDPAWSGVNRLGNLFYYGFAVVGLLASLAPGNTSISRFNLVFCGILLTGLVYAVFVALDIEVMIGRWFVFLDILLAVPAAIGLIFLVNCLSAGWVRLGILSAASLSIAVLMITNTTASFDSPVYPVYLKDRTALTASEMDAAATIGSVYSGNIVMDYAHSLSLAGRDDVRVANLSARDIQNRFEDIQGLLVLREYTVDNVFVAKGTEGVYKAQITYDPYQALADRGFHRVYDDGSVSGYVR